MNPIFNYNYKAAGRLQSIINIAVIFAFFFCIYNIRPTATALTNSETFTVLVESHECEEIALHVMQKMKGGRVVKIQGIASTLEKPDLIIFDNRSAHELGLYSEEYANKIIFVEDIHTDVTNFYSTVTYIIKGALDAKYNKDHSIEHMRESLDRVEAEHQKAKDALNKFKQNNPDARIGCDSLSTMVVKDVEILQGHGTRCPCCHGHQHQDHPTHYSVFLTAYGQQNDHHITANKYYALNHKGSTQEDSKQTFYDEYMCFLSEIAETAA